MNDLNKKDQEYASAARNLVLAIAEHRQPDPSDLTNVLLHLEDELARRYPGLTLADRNDVIGDTLMATVGASKAGRIDSEAQPGGYLWRIAERRAIDRLRRPAELPLDEGSPLPSYDADDDAIAARLDERARASHFYQAMRLARKEGNHRVNKTVSVALTLAGRKGRQASTREIAEELGVSHDTVARHLQLFRQYLERFLE